MSYNITSVETLSSTLTISSENLRKVRTKYDGMLPENCFIDLLDDNKTDSIPILEVEWCDCYSGRSFDSLKVILCDYCSGEATVIFTWEDGANSALKVSGEDGNRRITEPNFKITVED